MGYTIVLDPGHGGSNEGGINGALIEKDLTVVVTNAMKDYLEQFDDVTVYVTRTSDVDMSIQQRLDFAKSVNADYFISLHFNMSTLHNLYGSEIWLPIQGDYYSKLYPFADQVISNFESMGFHNRGIKTRVGKSNDNYYGVIRIGTNYKIPSCIIEHCYLDNSNDAFAVPLNSGQLKMSLANFGVQDATALAKSLHLKSTALGIDYSSYKLNSKTFKGKVLPDETEPEINEISLVSADIPNGKITINMHAVDKQSFIQYYMYSTDGGVTYSALKDYPRTSWNKSMDNAVITLDVPKNKPANIITCVVNQYDKLTISNLLTVELTTVETPAAKSEPQTDYNVELLVEDKPEYETVTYDISKEPGQNNGSLGMKIGVFATGAILLLILITVIASRIFIKKKKKNVKKDY